MELSFERPAMRNDPMPCGAGIRCRLFLALGFGLGLFLLPVEWLRIALEPPGGKLPLQRESPPEPF